MKRIARLHGRLSLTALLFATALFGTPALAQQAPAQGRPAATTAAPSAAPATATTNAEYRIAPGDVIRITVFQNPDLSLEARVSEVGVISYPLLGQVNLGGLSVSAAERRIAEQLRDRNFVRQPQVSILVTQVRGNQVSVLGQVGKPGRFPLESGEVKLTEMLATVGGVLPTGADTVVVLGTRNGQPFRGEIDVPSIFGPDRRGGDLVLQNGDVIWVERAPSIYIYGEVQRPGALRLERNMSVLQALAASGGVTQRGTEKGLRVHRRNAEGRTQIVQPAMDDLLRPDDVVYVRESLF